MRELVLRNSVLLDESDTGAWVGGGFKNSNRKRFLRGTKIVQAATGTREERLTVIRRVRDAISEHIDEKFVFHRDAGRKRASPYRFGLYQGFGRGPLILGKSTRQSRYFNTTPHIPTTFDNQNS